MARKKNKRNKNGEWLLLIKIMAGMGLASLLIIAIAVFFVLSYRQGDHDIEIKLEPETSTITKGVPFNVNVNIDNKTGSMLKDSGLVVDLGKGLVNLNFGSGNDHTVRDSIGDIGGNSFTKRTLKILPVGVVGKEHPIRVNLSYAVGKTKFNKEIEEKINIDKSPIKIIMEQPDQVLAGSSFEINVKYINESDFDFENLSLEMFYPDVFYFESASLNPDSFNNKWNLGTLKGNSSGEITIRGRLEGELVSAPNFQALISAKFGNTFYPIIRSEKQIKTAEQPVRLSVTIGGNKQYTAKAGETLNYIINYENKSGINIKDVKVKADLLGDMFDIDNIETEARINRVARTLNWDSSIVKQLENLAPGETGSLTAKVPIKSIFPIGRLSDKNFAVEIKVTLESSSVPYYLETEELTSFSSLRAKISGLLIVDAKGFYRDASSGIVNSGTLPPKVGGSTQYTIHWIVRNYSTDVNNVVVEASLPENVDWTGITKSNIESVPVYNKSEKKMIWNIEKIKATKGVISSPVEGIFQVELTPSENYEGQFHPLISKTEITATDSFTGTTLNYTETPINTSLPDDSTVDAKEGIVAE